MIRALHPGSGFFTPSRIPDAGVKKALDPGYATLDSTQPAALRPKQAIKFFFPAQGMHGAHPALDSTQPARPRAKTVYSGNY